MSERDERDRDRKGESKIGRERGVRLKKILYNKIIHQRIDSRDQIKSFEDFIYKDKNHKQLISIPSSEISGHVTPYKVFVVMKRMIKSIR